MRAQLKGTKLTIRSHMVYKSKILKLLEKKADWPTPYGGGALDYSAAASNRDNSVLNTDSTITPVTPVEPIGGTNQQRTTNPAPRPVRPTRPVQRQQAPPQPQPQNNPFASMRGMNPNQIAGLLPMLGPALDPVARVAGMPGLMLLTDYLTGANRLGRIFGYGSPLANIQNTNYGQWFNANQPQRLMAQPQPQQTVQQQPVQQPAQQQQVAAPQQPQAVSQPQPPATSPLTEGAAYISGNIAAPTLTSVGATAAANRLMPSIAPRTTGSIVPTPAGFYLTSAALNAADRLAPQWLRESTTTEGGNNWLGLTPGRARDASDFNRDVLSNQENYGSVGGNLRTGLEAQLRPVDTAEWFGRNLLNTGRSIGANIDAQEPIRNMTNNSITSAISRLIPSMASGEEINEPHMHSYITSMLNRNRALAEQQLNDRISRLESVGPFLLTGSERRELDMYRQHLNQLR